MFRALCAYHQDVKIVLYSIWYHHTCKTKTLYINLVTYWDKYTEIHGQQNVKTFLTCLVTYFSSIQYYLAIAEFFLNTSCLRAIGHTDHSVPPSHSTFAYVTYSLGHLCNDLYAISLVSDYCINLKTRMAHLFCWYLKVLKYSFYWFSVIRSWRVWLEFITLAKWRIFSHGQWRRIFW